MRIGELAKQTGTDVETVRYYEKIGLLDAPGRNSSGYRDYGAAHQERLQFIRHCRSLQMSLSDIRALLDLKAEPAAACQSVNDLLDHQIERVRQRMESLRQLEEQLTTLRRQCGQSDSVRECAIIQNLSAPATDQAFACHTEDHF
jgi:Cd(II)/Pb(II)-responsive transcriptional regulator